MIFLYVSQRVCAGLLLGLMPVSFNPTQGVTQYPLVCIQDGSIRVKPSASHHAKTNRLLSRIGSCYIFNNCDRSVELRVMLPLFDKKNDCFSVHGFCNRCNTAFEALGRHYFCPSQEARPFPSDADIEKGVTKWDQEQMRRGYIRQKGSQIIEMWDCEWWIFYKTDASVKKHPRKFSSQLPFE